MKYSCLLVDDETLALRLLEEYVSKLPQLEIVATCQNALSAMEYLQTRSIDILFLDIQMPDLTGIELLKIIKNKPAVIFTTAYADYALEGYQLDVIDYLLKPISFERFVLGVNKAIEWRNYQITSANKSNQAVPSLTPDHTNTLSPDHFFVKSDYKLIKIRFDAILYVEGLREYVSIYTNEKRIITLETMKHMEALLPSEHFMRVHKSYIVNLQKVDALNGNMLELGKDKISIGKIYKEDVMKVFQIRK